jgi:hypothetical protein
MVLSRVDLFSRHFEFAACSPDIWKNRIVEEHDTRSVKLDNVLLKSSIIHIVVYINSGVTDFVVDKI